jgi:hypothetical protein
MLKWVFGADVGPFKRGLSEMRGEAQAFSGSVKNMLAGAFGGAAVAAWASNMFQHLSRVQDLADRLGVSAESIQKVGESAKLSGTDMETAAKGLGKLVRSIAQAEQGSEGMNDALATLGLRAGDLANLSPENQLVAIAQGFENCANRGQAVDAVITLMGRSGEQMLPMLSQGAASLAEQLNNASFASDSATAAIGKLGDQIDKLKSDSVPFFGAMAQWLLEIGNYAGSVAYGIGSAFSMAFRAVKGEFDSLKEFTNEFQIRKDAVNQAFTERHNEIFGKPNPPDDNGNPAEPKTTPKADPQSEREDAGHAKKAEADHLAIVEKRKQLEEQVAKLKEDARQRALNDEQKLIDAEERRAKAITSARNIEAFAERSEDPDKAATQALEFRKQALEIEKEIADLKDQRKQQADREKEQQNQLNTRLTETLATEKELQHQRELDGMNPSDRLNALQSDKAASDEKAANLERQGKKQEASEERMRGMGIQDTINSTQQGIDSTLKQEAEKRHDMALDGMSKMDRMKALKGDKAASDKKAADLEAKGDKQGASEERQRGLDIQKEISGMAKDAKSELERLKQQGPTIEVSSLQSIGAGGSATVFSSDNTQRQIVDYLRIIAENSKSEGGTTTKPQERI